MNYKTNVSRTIISAALITTGLFFLVSQHVQTNSDSLTFGAELTEAQTSQSANALPAFENAKVESHPASAPLSEEISRWAKSATEPQWLGYELPAIYGDSVICCGGRGDWNGYRDCGPCYLEDKNHGDNFSTGPSKTKLESPRNLVVLYRAAEGKLGKVRVASEDCTLDAGGLRVTWLTGVNPTQSVKLLSTLVRDKFEQERHGESLSHGALTAIAMHGDAAADKVLNSFVDPAQPEELRKQTVFWLGEARGTAGFQTLKQLAQTETSTEVRSHISFALSLSRESGAVDEMIRMAKEDKSTHVRGQALFWLAHKAGQKAESAITGTIENDPDTEIKKKAVFALSQLPHEAGVPKLIQVAQNNKNPEVRKQAMFWLGQSNDPRALEFFEQILSK